MKIFKKSISLLLSLVMILSLFSVPALGAGMSNLNTGSRPVPTIGKADKKWQGYGDIHGYKISVWYAPLDKNQPTGDNVDNQRHISFYLQ